MPTRLKKVFIISAIVYGISLPVAFLVGGIVFSRPFRHSVGLDDVKRAGQTPGPLFGGGR